MTRVAPASRRMRGGARHAFLTAGMLRCSRLSLLAVLCLGGSSGSRELFALVPTAPLACRQHAAAYDLRVCDVLGQLRRCSTSLRPRAPLGISCGAAVALADRDMDSEPRKSLANTDGISANTNTVGDGAVTGLGQQTKDTKAFLRRQGAKWRAEVLSWTSDAEGRVIPRDGSSSPAELFGEVKPGSYVRADLAEFLAQNPLFGEQRGTGTIVKTNRLVTTTSPSSAGPPRLNHSEAYRDVGLEDGLRDSEHVFGAWQQGAVAKSQRSGGTELIDCLRMVKPTAPPVAQATQEAIAEQSGDSMRALVKATRPDAPEQLQTKASASAPKLAPKPESQAPAPTPVQDIRKENSLQSLAALGVSVNAGETRSMFQVGSEGDDDPMVLELLRDVFAEEAAEDLLNNASWENELLRDVFAQNPLTRKGSIDALERKKQRGTVTALREANWELEMMGLFSQSPLLRRTEPDTGYEDK